jgi:two-component system, sensor histidine kinase YesM
MLLSVLLMITVTYYQAMKEQVLAQYSKDTHLSVTQTNTIIDLKLQKIEDSSRTIIQDKDMLRIFENINPSSQFDILTSMREVRRILIKYFSSDEWIYAYNIITSYFKFGYGYVPYNEFLSSDLGTKIIEGNGKLIWYPTYDFAEMFQLDYLRGYNTDFRFLFSAGRVINGFDTTSNPWVQKASNKDTLILLICLRESFFKDAYAKLLQENGLAFVVTQDRQLVSQGGDDVWDSVKNSQWLPQILREGSGVRQEIINGQQAYLCYDTSQVTGWTLVSAAYTKNLTTKASSWLVSSVIGFVIPLALVSMFLAVLVSLAITRPLKQLFGAIMRTGKGDFTNKIPVQGYGEFSRLISQFNAMNDQIARLIDENYSMKLHEKESQLKALNAQINPHFLYNTLNLVNCMAIERNAREIAGVVRAMSKILRYTVDNTCAEGLLSEELQWLDNYVFIMSCRYEGQIEYICDVEESLLTQKTPRLFLQPFVENAFVHGFKNMQSGCRLSVYGYMEPGYRCFSIADNGCGIPPEHLENLLSGENNAVGIANTYRRMQLMYEGKCQVEYFSREGEGTKVVIRLPV